MTDTVATKADAETAELRLRAEIARVRGEIAGLHSRLVWWIIGTGAIAARRRPAGLRTRLQPDAVHD